MLREAHRQSPESPIIRNELAKSLVLAAGKSGSAETVVAMCRDALTVDPTDFWAAYKLALHAVTTEQWTDAAEYLRQGLTIYPDAALLLSLRAQMLAAQGDLTAACRDYEVVVRKLPRSAVFWEAYADCLERLGHAAESVSARARSRQLRGQ